MKKVIIISLLFPLLTCLVKAAPDPSHVKARLISEVESIRPGQSFWVAVELKMQKNWHTYWKNPGESGVPTKISWHLPTRLTAGPIHWPYPHKIAVPPVVSYGFEKETWLLVPIKAQKTLPPGQDVELSAHVSWLECSIECIPGEADVSLRMPVRKSPPALNKDSIEKFAEARAKWPLQKSGWSVRAVSSGNQLQLELRPPPWFKERLRDLYFFADQPKLIDYSAPQKFFFRNGSYYLNLNHSEAVASTNTPLSGVLVAEPGWRGRDSEKAWEVKCAVSPGKLVSKVGLSVFYAIVLAFLGGLLLNLMPCVLPILAIKVLGLLNQAASKKLPPLLHAGLFLLGVLVSFWCLAGLLLILRAGGEQIGWGFQMQSPGFVFFLISLFFLLGLNLVGVFEIGLSLTRLLAPSSPNPGMTGAFASGILTTIVATPCTAPFMGSSLGYASTQPAPVSLSVFTALGLGVAAPYVLLSMFPRLLVFLPKPGRWMESLKQLMGFAMMAASIWLFWVLLQQVDRGVAIPVLSLLLLQGFGSWIYGRWGQNPGSWKSRILLTLFFLIIVTSLYWGVETIAHSEKSHVGPQSENPELRWEPYSEETVSLLRHEGRPVFVDFTAAWCLTCKVNERVALNTPAVVHAFKKRNIALLKADWTSRSPEITQALQRFGRNGVPLYVLYPADPKLSPRLLPELLTPKIVLNELEKI